MADNKQVKALGLRFAHALHTSIKTAIIFTIDHKSVERTIQQSFQLLNHLLKETGQFTFGFVDSQIMLNNLLTTDASLRSLETAFLKRGIAAVTFEPGLSLSRYKRFLGVLAAPSKIVEQAGGLLLFLDQNQVEGARILPAAKNQRKDANGDTIIDTDSEAYILSKQLAEDSAPRDLLDSIDALLQSACFDASTRAEIFSSFASPGMNGTGYGVPISMPRLVLLKEGETVASAGSGAQSENGTADRSALDPQQHLGANPPGFAGAGNSPGPLAPPHWLSADQGIATANLAAALRGAALDADSDSFMHLVERSVERSLVTDRGNPEKSYASLARILRTTGVDKILARFPRERQEELSGLSPEQIAAEYIEDTAFALAGTKLKSAKSSAKLVIDQDVVGVLVRSLQATQRADKLAKKLAQFIKDFAVPVSVQERIAEELRWTGLNTGKKYARLMEIKHYSSNEFRRLLDLLRELVAQRALEQASALASHYFDFLDEPDSAIQITDLGRIPELIRSAPLIQVGFATQTAERLGRTLLRENLPELLHFQLANALTVLSQSIAAFEGFADLLKIGAYLEGSLKRDPERHWKCCNASLSAMLPAGAIERIIELFLLQRADSSWSKDVATLLRFAAPASVESVFEHMVDEKDGRKRVALVRLASQLGPESIRLASKHLADERWYVVRNMCRVLAELRDPELAEHIAPAFEHSDVRVQQAALKALIKSRTVEAAPVLAAALSKLAPELLDEALDELMFLRQASTAGHLARFVQSGDSTVATAKKAVQVLAAISDDQAVQALGRLVCTERLDMSIRQSALDGLSRSVSPHAASRLAELAKTGDALPDELRALMKLARAKACGS